MARLDHLTNVYNALSILCLSYKQLAHTSTLKHIQFDFMPFQSECSENILCTKLLEKHKKKNILFLQAPNHQIALVCSYVHIHQMTI